MKEALKLLTQCNNNGIDKSTTKWTFGVFQPNRSTDTVFPVGVWIQRPTPALEKGRVQESNSSGWKQEQENWAFSLSLSFTAVCASSYLVPSSPIEIHALSNALTSELHVSCGDQNVQRECMNSIGLAE